MTQLTSRRLDSSASLTAQFNAAQRAAETMRPPDRRLLDDPYARHFVDNPFLRAVLLNRCASDIALRAIDVAWGGLHAHVALRVRYSDDAYDAALDNGVTQVVLLGAGFDSTGLRHATDPVMVYEVDARTTQSAKLTIVADLTGADSLRRTAWVPCDFEHDTLLDSLLISGFDRTQPCLVLWLGVTPYLTDAAIDATLADLANLCAPGSQLVLDHIVSGVSSGKTRWNSANRVTRMVSRRGEPYRSDFTPNQLAVLLCAHGFALREHLTVSALLRRYDPENTSRVRSDSWLAVATAERIEGEPK